MISSLGDNGDELAGAPDATRNIRFVIAYLGTAYHGWQIQPSAPTVQGEIEASLRQITNRPSRLRAAGRTDSGVHAKGQVANLLTNSDISNRSLFRGLNALLPRDISILSAEDVSLSFDSRRHNKGKHYRYTIWNRREPAPERTLTTWQLHRPLDTLAMAEAGRALVGAHDFASFRSASCDRTTTVRTLFRCTVSAEQGLVTIDVEGTAFLKNMVRIIVGTLVEVGRGKREPRSIGALLQAGDRAMAGVTAPPHGLCLMRVFL